MKTMIKKVFFLLFTITFSFELQAQHIAQSVSGQPEEFQYQYQGLTYSKPGSFYSHLWWFGDNQFSFQARPTTIFPGNGSFTVFAAPTENYGTGGPPPKTTVSNPNSGAPINSRILGPNNSLRVQHYRNAVPDDTLFLLLTYSLPDQISAPGLFDGTIVLKPDQQVKIATNIIGSHPEFHPNAEVFDQNDTWEFTGLKSGVERTILIPIEVIGANQEVVNFQAFLNIRNHEIPQLENVNQFSLKIPVADSHDPNFMLENSEAINDCDFGGEPIRYKIHFQNVGDTTTQYVQVKCHLDPKLNLGTIDNIQLPKEYGNVQATQAPLNNTYVAGQGPIYSYDETTHVLTFEFNDLVLRTTQDPRCKDLNLTRSSVEFTIRVLPNYKFGPPVVSQSTIIFDDNLPIVTNSVSTICADPISPGGFYSNDPTIQIAQPIKEEKTHLKP